jgi:hypothetical protein
MAEYLLVKPQIVGDPTHGYETIYEVYDRFPTVAQAKRWGWREFDHDDFQLAVVDGDRLLDLTWMGEPLEPDGASHDELVELASVLGLKPPPAASSEVS